MKNPIKPLRIAYISALTNVSFPVWDRRIPKDIEEPFLYGLITSQTATDIDRTKCGNVNTDCTVLVDIIYKQTQGYADSAIVDDACDEVLQIIHTNAQIIVPGFQVIDTELSSLTVDDAFEFDTQTVIRGLIRFRHILAEV